MKKLRRIIASFLPVLLLLTLLTGNAGAALQAVGPTDVATGFPLWYQDAGGLAVQECLDLPSTTGNVPYCTLLSAPGFNPLLPIVALPTLSNYPVEMFYWVADARLSTIPNTPTAVAALRLGLEGTFALGTQTPGQQITFLLVNLQKMTGLPPNTTYTVTHPYGSFTFTTDAAGSTPPTAGQAFRVRDDAVPVPLVFNTLLAAPTTLIGPLLKASATVGGAPLPFIVDPVSGNTYLANPLIPTFLTGSPTGNNIFSISGPGIGGPGVNLVSTNLWNLQGRVFVGQVPSPLTINRATYARDAVTGQIDVFTTALPTALLSIGGTGLAASSMTQDLPNTGKFFAHIPVATLPTGVIITNSLDIPPIQHPVTLVDEVVISQANYNPVTRNMTIKADSRDNLAPLPTLTVPAFAAPNTLDATGTLVKAIPLNSIPPMSVVVTSSNGGSATANVSVVTPPAPPVAVADTATTTANTAVVIPVLANDTPAATIDITSVVTATALNGTAVANPNGTVTFTPTAAFTGAASFTYTVKDTFGQASNSVTVAVTVTAAAVGPATGVIVTPTIVSPQAPLTPITFVAAGSGGSGNYQYQFSIKSGGIVYTVTRPYSTVNTWTWTPTLPGAYDIQVDVRVVGSVAASEAVANVFFYQIETPATTVTVTPNLAAPRAPGTPITFTATATGGSGPFEYRFWVNNGNGYAVAQNYSSANTFIWTPTKPGIYDILVDVRGFGSTVFRDALTTLLAYQVAPAPATAVSLTPSLVSPRLHGTPITFTAVASGGVGPFEYRFWVNVGGTYVIAQDYSTINTWVWTPLTAGNYDILVDTRAVGSTLFREALNQVFFYQIQ
jgi:Bacterial Ig domain